MLRGLALIALVSTSACGPALLDPAAAPPATLRERLATEVTRLQVTTAASTGSLVAERKSEGAWIEGAVDLPYANGELVLASDGADGIILDDLQLTFAPILIPPTVFAGKMAELRDVRVDLEDAVRATAVWDGDDKVTLTAALPLILHWSISIEGGTTPLGTPTLPAVPVQLTLTGADAHAEATLLGHAPGELWTWAGLVRLRDLDLSVAAAL